MPDEQEALHPMDFAKDVLDFIQGDSIEEAAPAEDTVTETPEAATDEGATTEPARDESGRLRGPDGKFVAEQNEDEEQEGQESSDEETPADEQSTDTVDEWEIELDPELEKFLAKYDGDLNKALRGAVEAQKTLGRQGSEIGELRKLESEILELKQAVMQRNEAPAPDHTNYGDLIERDPRQAAMKARDNKNWDAMAAAVDVWKEEDPFEASVFLTTTVNAVELENIRAEYEQKLSGLSAAPAAQTSDEQEAAKVLERHPDLEKFLPAIGQIAQERPLLSGALQHGSPSEKAEALETLYLIARSRSDADTSSDAVKRARVKAAAEGQQARADAQVVSASRGSAASADSPTRVDQFLDAFDARMKERGLMGDDS